MRPRILSDRQVLGYLADETGGTSWYFRGALNRGLTEVEERSRRFYVLSFQVERDDPEEIEIDVAAVSAEVEVTWAPSRLVLPTRAGGWDSVQQELRVAEALQIGTDTAEFSMDLHAIPVDLAGGRGRLAVFVDLGADQLGELANQRGDGGLGIEILGLALTRWGNVVDHFRTRLDVPAGSIGETRPADDLHYFNMLSVPPGRYYVKTIVREAGTGMLSSRSLGFEVPSAEPGGLAVAEPLFVVPPNQRDVVRGSAAAAVGSSSESVDRRYPFVVDGRELVPVFPAAHSPGESGWVYLRARNFEVNLSSGEPAVSVDALLLSPEGMPIDVADEQVVAAETEAGTTNVRILLHYRLPEPLASGAYSLAVDVRDHVARRRVQAQLPLVVTE